MSALTKSLLVVVALGLMLAAGLGLAALHFLDTPASTSNEETVFEIRPGESFHTVARRLQQQGLVASAAKLQLYARLTNSGSRVRVGEYAVRRDVRPKDLMAILTSGKSIEYSITVHEGLNRFEIADLVARARLFSKQDFLKVTEDPALIQELLGENLPSLEGYLFPETYHITKFTGARGLARMMVNRFKENFAKVQPGAGINMTRNQIVILASIIEKETGAPEERAVISSVFHNRLRQNMRLQTDPTIVYEIYLRTGAWNGNISRADLTRPSAYNSYLNSGLPPGPIANPGLEALKAAAAPAESDFLFFVSRNDGTHIFSKDYAQHLKAVARYQLDKKAREGKSWRDLQKRQVTPDHVVAAPEEPQAVRAGGNFQNRSSKTSP